MQATQKERIDFITRMQRAGLDREDAESFMRYAATLYRLAIASCNGEWPAGGPVSGLKVCPHCDMMWCKATFARGMCPDCRTTDLATKLANTLKIEIETGGDPRGSVIKLRVPGDNGNDFGGSQMVCVPQPRY